MFQLVSLNVFIVHIFAIFFITFIPRARCLLSRATVFCVASLYDLFTARSKHAQHSGDWDAMDGVSFISSHMRILVTFYVCIFQFYTLVT